MAVYLNGVEVRPTVFPDKTQQVWQLPDIPVCLGKPMTIHWDFESDSELMTVAQLRTLVGPHTEVVLVVDYLPYGRQDKLVSNKTTFGLHTFATLINALKFHHVMTTDAHSGEAMRLIERLVDKPVFRRICAVIVLGDFETVVFPDAGAAGRYTTRTQDALSTELLPRTSALGVLQKTRDPATGALTMDGCRTVHGDLTAAKRILMVDDICDGGRTFELGAQVLRKLNPTAVIGLYVTHALMTRGFDHLVAAGITEFYDHKQRLTP